MTAQMIKQTKTKYITIIIFIILLGISGSIYYENDHNDIILKDQIESLEETIEIVFLDNIKELEILYTTLTSSYQNSLQFQELMRHRDRVGLQKMLHKDYKSLREINPNLYIMHLIDTQNITILRMHKPNSYDDNLTNIRPIVRLVNHDKIKKSGFEVGKNGITYRVTIPYFDDQNRHLGIIEYGIKPSYFVEKLQNNLDMQALVLIKTKALQVLIEKVKREKIGDYSILKTTPLFERILPKINLKQQHQLITFNEKSYLIKNNLSLNSCKGECVARIVVAKDITSFVNRHRSNLLYANIISLLILLLLGGISITIFNFYTKEITALNKKAMHFEEKATTDNLTALHNREYLVRFYEDILSYADDQICIAIMFDIDHFKQVNDTYGHIVGDRVLTTLAELTKTYFRKTDILIRYGGEEFILFVKNISYSKACQKVEGFRQYIENSDKFDQNITITISVGVVVVDANEQLEQLIDRADKLLYQAKESGRNRVICQEDQE